MKRELLLLLVALCMGAIGGYLATMTDNEADSTRSQMSDENSRNHDQFSLNPFTTTTTDKNNIHKLEQEISRLRTRLDELESKLDVTQSLNMSDTEATPEQTETITNPVRSDPLTKENLVNAGVNEGLAAEIIRRKSELEYKQLELRDRAIRENYMNTPRYFQQLRELNANATSLRDDIGSEAYDRYLYAAGQNNRVVVSSVMSSSPAEQSGLQKGDIILRYDNEKIFNWNEIRQATGQGNRNEYITIDIIRDGQLMNMVLPRGPLGVKLDSTRSNPDN
ncbi:MAG TPA: PDZ domain-containing protein [Gammaproteobacteria bacterium]